MKKFIATLALLVSTSGFCADMTYQCVNKIPNNQECMIALDVTAYDEVLVVEYTGGKLEYCNGWVTSGCPFTGTKRVLNGEFSSQQLLDFGFKAYTRKENSSILTNQWTCRLN